MQSDVEDTDGRHAGRPGRSTGILYDHHSGKQEGRVISRAERYNQSGFTWFYQIQSSNYQKSYEDLTAKMEERGMDKDSLQNVAQEYEQDRVFRSRSAFFLLDLSH